MRWRGRQRSSNVEDRRGTRPKLAVGGGGIIVVIIVLALRFFDAPPAVQQLGGQIAQQLQNDGNAAPVGAGLDDESREFVSVVLHDTETVWTQLFDQQVQGGSYVPPRLVMFSESVNSGCGMASSAMGPFYCPADRTVYLDPQFFDELARRHRSPGDFAAAYVIAHEVAHHVQNLMGYSDLADRARRSGSERDANRMSVRLELQADFLAGIWAFHADRHYDILEDGDVQEAIQAAFQIGDDTLQREARREIRPEHFTHGSSVQRTHWFRRGVESGKLKDCELLFQLDYEQL